MVDRAYMLMVDRAYMVMVCRVYVLFTLDRVGCTCTINVLGEEGSYQVYRSGSIFCLGI